MKSYLIKGYIDMPDNIGIIFNTPKPGNRDSMDVLTQVNAIERSLSALGHHPVRIPFTKDLPLFVQTFRQNPLDMVFNLCETVDEDAGFCGHPAAVLELLGVPFTGSPSTALMVSTDKVLTKRLIKSCHLLTPQFLLVTNSRQFNPNFLKFPLIVKPQFEDASIGIDQDSVITEKQEINQRLDAFIERFGSVIIEEFIQGREFNVSLMGFPTLSPLPVAEIDFTGLPKNYHQIVGYKAKWDESSTEYKHTTRKFPENLSPRIRRKIENTAVICARLLMIRDYGRVDIRMDKNENIYVLEVNANPCLSPDAGIAAAALKSGLNYDQMIGKIVDYVKKRSSPDNSHIPQQPIQDIAV